MAVCLHTRYSEYTIQLYLLEYLQWDQETKTRPDQPTLHDTLTNKMQNRRKT